jgi:hypothetical protein
VIGSACNFCAVCSFLFLSTAVCPAVRRIISFQMLLVIFHLAFLLSRLQSQKPTLIHVSHFKLIIFFCVCARFELNTEFIITVNFITFVSFAFIFMFKYLNSLTYSDILLLKHVASNWVPAFEFHDFRTEFRFSLVFTFTVSSVLYA